MNPTAKRIKIKTAKSVEAANEPGRYKEVEVRGLYLQVSPSGTKSWLLRYEHLGREKWMGLGPIDLVSLKEARERARAARKQLLDGIDPIEHRKAERAAQALKQEKAMTFEEAAHAYFNQHEMKWKNAKHRNQFLSTLKRYAFDLPIGGHKPMGQLPVNKIDTGLVLKVLEQPLNAERGFPAGIFWHVRTETANRTRARVEAVLDWAAVRGYRTENNPARWKGHLDQVLAAPSKIRKVRHHPALPFNELPDFMEALRTHGGVAARALVFTILTGARTSEVIGAQWSEINLDDEVWTVPAERIKGGKEHKVPLPERALEILRALPRERSNDFIFIGPRGGGLSNMAMSTLLKRMGRTDITVHGFRSTFRDWAAERTNYQNHVIEMALSHVIGDKVEAAYRRGDLFEKRKRLMRDWAYYCQSEPATMATEVVPLRAQQ